MSGNNLSEISECPGKNRNFCPLLAIPNIRRPRKTVDSRSLNSDKLLFMGEDIFSHMISNGKKSHPITEKVNHRKSLSQ